MIRVLRQGFIPNGKRTLTHLGINLSTECQNSGEISTKNKYMRMENEQRGGSVVDS